MPDIPALALAVTRLDVLDRWVDDRKLRQLVGSAALVALAILQKLTVTFVILPVLYLFWLALGRHIVKHREPYLFGIVAGVPSLAWYAHALSMTPQRVFAIQRDLFLDTWNSGFNPILGGTWFHPD